MTVQGFKVKVLPNLRNYRIVQFSFFPESNMRFCNFLFETNFLSLSHLEMLASYFPNVKVLGFRPGVENLGLESRNKIRAFHSVLQRFKQLYMFACWCSIPDVQFLRFLFVGWEITYGNQGENTLTITK